MRRPVRSASAVLAVVLLTAGCAAGPRTAVHASRAPVGGSAAPSADEGLGNAASGGSAGTTGGSSSARRCRSGDLKVRLAPAGGGMGRRYAAMEVRNGSSSRCFVGGFVDLRLYGAGGRPVPTQVVRDKATAEAVTLAPGRSAWVAVSWTVISADDETAVPCQPPTSAVDVSIPDAGPAIRVDFAAGPVCQGGRLTVSPLSAERPAG